MKTSEKYISEMESKKRGTYYQVIVKYVDSEGVRRSKSFGQFYVKDYGSKKLALSQARKAREQALREIEYKSIEHDDISVEECYKASLDLFNLSVKTRERHQTTFNGLFGNNSALLKKSIKLVTTEDVIISINKYAENNSQESVKRAKTIWHQIFQTAQMKEIPVIDRTLSIKLPRSKRVPKKRPMECTYDDVLEILENLTVYGSDERSRKRAMDIHDMILIMFYEGLRPQEVLALSKSEIDLNEKELNIFLSVGSTTEKKRQIINTKNDQSVRTIPIAEELYPMLADLCNSTETDLLFVDDDGLPYEIGGIDSALYNMRKDRNLPRVTLYMCRHLFATDVYGLAKNKKAAQRLMGHKDEAMTLYYINDDDEEKNALIQARKLS